MLDAIRVYLPWLLSAITIYMTVLAGNKSRNAWLFGLANQALWLVWILATASWGLLPMNLALWLVYARNHLKWQAASSTVSFHKKADGILLVAHDGRGRFLTPFERALFAIGIKPAA